MPELTQLAESSCRGSLLGREGCSCSGFIGVGAVVEVVLSSHYCVVCLRLHTAELNG